MHQELRRGTTRFLETDSMDLIWYLQDELMVVQKFLCIDRAPQGSSGNNDGNPSSMRTKQELEIAGVFPDRAEGESLALRLLSFRHVNVSSKLDEINVFGSFLSTLSRERGDQREAEKGFELGVKFR